MTPWPSSSCCPSGLSQELYDVYMGRGLPFEAVLVAAYGEQPRVHGNQFVDYGPLEYLVEVGVNYYQASLCL
jgi:hypothetical protein